MIGPLWDQLFMRLCMRSPKHKDDVLVLCHQVSDHRLSECLPALFGMRGWFVCPDGEDGIQEQHPLPCPLLEGSIARSWVSQVCFDLVEDVDQAGWTSNTRGDAECQPHGLSRVVVRILSKYHHPNIGWLGTEDGPIEDEMLWWVHLLLLSLLPL